MRLTMPAATPPMRKMALISPPKDLNLSVIAHTVSLKQLKANCTKLVLSVGLVDRDDQRTRVDVGHQLRAGL